MLVELVIVSVACLAVAIACAVLVRRLEKSHSPFVASAIPELVKAVEKAADVVDPSSSSSS